MTHRQSRLVTRRFTDPAQSLGGHELQNLIYERLKDAGWYTVAAHEWYGALLHVQHRVMHTGNWFQTPQIPVQELVS